ISSGSAEAPSSGIAESPPDRPAPPDTPPDTGNGPGTGPGGSSSTGGGGYPKPGDPRLHCAPDGRSFRYDPSPDDCPPPPPPPSGLCAADYGYDAPVGRACAGLAGTSIPDGAPVPADWPCPIPVSPTGDAGKD